MKKQFVIVGAITLVLTVFLGACSSISSNVAQKPLEDAKASPEVKALEERKAIEKLIATNDKFAVCKMYEAQVTHWVEYQPQRYIAEIAWEGYHTTNNPALNLMDKVGYGTTGPTGQWLLSAKGRSAIGATIRQVHIRAADLQVDGNRVPTKNGTCSLEEARKKVGQWKTKCDEIFSWRLILGCRELVQIDGTTPLADGMRVDFSWRWHPTELGTADGLVDSRQRAEAFLRKTSSGLLVDKMYFKQEQQ